MWLLLRTAYPALALSLYLCVCVCLLLLSLTLYFELFAHFLPWRAPSTDDDEDDETKHQHYFHII